MKLIPKKDLLTGETFIPMRINQKFSCPDNRTIYNNHKANALRQKVANINKPLLINFRILNELMDGKKTANFHKQFLAGKGFSFTVHTHYVEYEGKMEIAIYDYIIIKADNDQIKIIKQ